MQIKLQNIRIMKSFRACINAAFWHVLCQSHTKFSAEVGSRGYHVYHKTSWRNIHLHQHVVVLKEVNNISINVHPYCCRIPIKRDDRIRPVTVGHVARELSRFVFYSFQEGGSVTGTAASTTPRISPKPQGGLEVPILMYFTHENKAISLKMEILVVKQL